MRTLAWLFLFFLPTWAQAGDECYRDHLVVDRTQVWELNKPQDWKFRLPTRHPQKPFLTFATANFYWDANQSLLSALKFETDLVSLPYNVYRLDIQMGEGENAVVQSWDFTGNCQGPGLSFYPGAKIDLPVMKGPPPVGTSKIRVRIWGVLQ